MNPPVTTTTTTKTHPNIRSSVSVSCDANILIRKAVKHKKAPIHSKTEKPEKKNVYRILL